MTKKFLTGDVNKSIYSIRQARWKHHHIIAYGSGNNLIIYTINTESDSEDKERVHTIYLRSDLSAIEIDSENGYIIIAVENKIQIFKPLNEYMRSPEWAEALQFEMHGGSSVNCLLWAFLEHELVIGSSDFLALYYVYDEYGVLKYRLRWSLAQASPVTYVRITDTGSKMISSGGPFERLVKLWSRISYDDCYSLFELSYLEHPVGSFVTDAFWKKAAIDKSSSVDKSMVNIRNIRGYIGADNDGNDIIYTYSSDKVLRIWVSHDTCGHVHFNLWTSLNLNETFEEADRVISFSVIENRLLHKTLIPLLNSKRYQSRITDYFRRLRSEDFDLLMLLSSQGKFMFYAVINASRTTPSVIKFEQLTKTPILLGKYCSPTFSNGNFFLKDVKVSRDLVLSESFDLYVKPMRVANIETIDMFHDVMLSVLIHDRMKNSIRFNLLDFKTFLSSEGTAFNASLYQKFQGHEKSIRKLVKSEISPQKSVLLSILNFSKDNYLWEPIYLDKYKKDMTLTKRFQINLCDESGGIWDAVIINDIAVPNQYGRTHVVVVLERNGCLSIWKCAPSPLNDHKTALVTRLEVTDKDKNRTKKLSKAFFLVDLSSIQKSKKGYLLVAIYEHDFVRSWCLHISQGVDDNIIEIYDSKINDIPIEHNLFQIASVDSFVLNQNRNILATISSHGKFKLFSLFLEDDEFRWNEETSFFTNINNASRIHESSSINKLAIVDEKGTSLSIWDTKSGILEYEEEFLDESGVVKDLDWTFITSSESALTMSAVLSVGFERTVSLYTQLRYDYTNAIPTFAVLKKIDISSFTSHAIGDLVWLNEGYLVIGTGNQIFIDDKWVRLNDTRGNFLDSTIRQLLIGYKSTSQEEEEGSTNINLIDNSQYDIEHLVRILNGPLPLYHPQFLIQGLYMNQFDIVKDILLRLLKIIRIGDPITWDLNMDMTDKVFESGTQSRVSGHSTPTVSLKLNLLDDMSQRQNNLEVFETINKHLLAYLIEQLTKVSLPLLTRHQQITLTTVATIVGELENYASALDQNGARFLIGLKIFELSTKQAKLAMRDMNWALHSENKEMLLGLVEKIFKYNLKWENVAQTGLTYWVPKRRLAEIIESCAKNEFADTRDPAGLVSLFYLALHKKQVLVGLWKTVSHPEKSKILNFLNHDFNDPRWKSAAAKNAFVLLGKHRYVDAAYFFLLSGKLKDCCEVIARNLNDYQLALTVAKIYSEHQDQQSRMATVEIIENHVLPKAIHQGDKWMTSWIFWELELYELSVQALVKSPIDTVLMGRENFSKKFQDANLSDIDLKSSSKSFLKDDPALILLFSLLRHESVHYLRGSLAIKPQEEFDFVIKICSIYTRMGCDYLAILLILNWTFITYNRKSNEIKWDKASNNLFNFNPKDSSMPISILESGTSETSNTENVSKLPPSSAFEEPDMSAFDFGF